MTNPKPLRLQALPDKAELTETFHRFDIEESVRQQRLVLKTEVKNREVLNQFVEPKDAR